MFLSPFSIPGGFEERHKKSSVRVIGSSQNVIHHQDYEVDSHIQTIHLHNPVAVGINIIICDTHRLWDLYMQHNLSGFMHVMTSSLICCHSCFLIRAVTTFSLTDCHKKKFTNMKFDQAIDLP
jgi:hypothetical protein